MTTSADFRHLCRAARRLAAAEAAPGRPGVPTVTQALVELSEAAIIYALAARTDAAELAEAAL